MEKKKKNNNNSNSNGCVLECGLPEVVGSIGALKACILIGLQTIRQYTYLHVLIHAFHGGLSCVFLKWGWRRYFLGLNTFAAAGGTVAEDIRRSEVPWFFKFWANNSTSVGFFEHGSLTTQFKFDRFDDGRTISRTHGWHAWWVGLFAKPSHGTYAQLGCFSW